MLIIIFSLNRAIFLHTLLKSLEWNIKNKNIEVIILYNYTNAFYKSGYDKLINTFNYRFMKEENIRRDSFKEYLGYPRNLLRLIKYKPYRNHKTNFRFVLVNEILNSKYSELMFLTDDSLFYREFEVTDEIIQNILSNPFNNSFHLRFGLNYERKPNNITTEGNICSWYLNKNNDKDYSYRFSIDGQIYNKELLLRIMRKIIFINPTTLEGNINYYCSKKNLLKNGFCFKESVLVGFELNIVSNMSNNNNLNIDNKLLNKYYLDGYEMKYIFDSNNVRSYRPYLNDVLLLKGDKNISVLNNFQKIKDGKYRD